MEINNNISKSNKITILSDFIANQIAAGEVVQRPESVIKELIENSLDAAANSIAVIVKDAGKQLIHIVDNGTGMSQDDLALSIKRHATSKIFNAEDLDEIRTFGFRGEALASICSVANVEIRSSQLNDEHGWKLIAEPMKTDIIEPCIMDKGTQIFVRNLFYNVPARRKFLKSNITEFRYISDTMLKFAISMPEIRFTFYDSDNLIFDVFPEPLDKRIGKLFGDNIAKQIIPVDYAERNIRVFGFIGSPEIAKQTRSGQYFFLNKRSIISKSLSHAVFSSFEHLLENNRNPFFILFLELDPKKYDVNVHPQKHEVKFDDERIIYSIIHRAVANSLQRHGLIADLIVSENFSKSPIEKEETSLNSNNDLLLVNKMTGEIINPNPNYNQNNNYNYNSSQRYNYNYTKNNYPNPNNSLTSNHFQTNDIETRVNSSANTENSNNTNNSISAFDYMFGKSIPEQISTELFNQIELQENDFWQLNNKYIFVSVPDGVLIIDQHAAHERVLYEKAIKAMNKEFANAQELLFPVRVQINAIQSSIIREILEEINSIGYTIGIITESEIEISSVPLDIKSGYEAQSLIEIIELYEEGEKLQHREQRDNLAASFSCKAAIKTGEQLSKPEMKSLFRSIQKCKMPYSCPHGRPTIIKFTMQELDKRFERT